jgi:hypothetical protein
MCSLLCCLNNNFTFCGGKAKQLTHRSSFQEGQDGRATGQSCWFILTPEDLVSRQEDRIAESIMQLSSQFRRVAEGYADAPFSATVRRNRLQTRRDNPRSCDT